MTLLCILEHAITMYIPTLLAPLPGINFQTALSAAAPQSSSTTSSLLLGAPIYPVTNQLFSFTMEGGVRRWTEKFPPMPTKQWGATALCTGTALIVAGGVGGTQETPL